MEQEENDERPGEKKRLKRNFSESSFKVWGRVLSIQSHTVHGYVGNKSATFPLQLLGFDVDPINSVQFSNHTGYKGGFRGQVLGGEQLEDLVLGLEENGLLKYYSHMLTGYIGSVSFLRKVLDVHKKVKSHCPDLIYFCDPVLGDNGNLYVPKDLVTVYREEVLPVVNVLTPNQFELELLTEKKVTDFESARVAFEILHSKGIETIILTSCQFNETKSDIICLLASVKKGDGKVRVFQAEQPLVKGYFTGTGDLIAALLLAWLARDKENFVGAIEKACTSMHAVVHRTSESRCDSDPTELQLVQSRKDIEEPDVYNTPIKVQEILGTLK